MVIILKPEDDADKILTRIKMFLEERGMEISARKTKLTKATDGFDFLGWKFRVQGNHKLRNIPSEENYKEFKEKVKKIVNSSGYGAEIKAKKLAPIVRGWRNYHRNCDMSGSRNSLWFIAKTANRRFRKEKKINRYRANELCEKGFPAVGYEQFKHINVKGTKSPYDGDLVYWSQRNSKLYDNNITKALKKQNHSCGCCGLKFLGKEKVEIHHIDGNHNNWKPKNLTAVHKSCHQQIHWSKSKDKPKG